MWFLLLWAIGLVLAGIHIAVSGGTWTFESASKIFLLYQFVVTFGLVALIGTYINIIDYKATAKRLGWPGGPFQIKYGFSQLTLGVMGVLAIWIDGTYWLGVMICMYMYGLSGLYTHSLEMIENHKIDAANVANIVMDILYQSFITALYLFAFGIW